MQFAAYAQVVYKLHKQSCIPSPKASSSLLLLVLLRVFARYTKRGN